MSNKNTTGKNFITIDRTTEGIRDFIFDEMERLANGQSDIDRLKAMSKASDTILKSAALDITMRKLVNDEKKNGGPKEVADMNLNLKLSGQTTHNSGV